MKRDKNAPRPPKKQRTFAIDGEVLMKAEQLATKENRSLNNWIECLMIDAIKLYESYEEIKIKTNDSKAKK